MLQSILKMFAKRSRRVGLRLVELGTSSSALGGDVRPKSSGRKKSMKSEAIPNELGSLHSPQAVSVGSSQIESYPFPQLIGRIGQLTQQYCILEGFAQAMKL